MKFSRLRTLCTRAARSRLPLTEGIGGRWMRRLQKRNVDRWRHSHDYLPPPMREAATCRICPTAWRRYTSRTRPDVLESARRRLAFDELFLIQAGLMQRRRTWEKDVVARPCSRHRCTRYLRSALPFSLTGAQERVIGSILQDIAKPQRWRASYRAMLLRQDGSRSAGHACRRCQRYQAAIMAPTRFWHANISRRSCPCWCVWRARSRTRRRTS